MLKHKKSKFNSIILPMSGLIIIIGLWSLVIHALPNEISFVEGRQEQLHFSLPVKATVENVNVLSVGNEPVAQNIHIDKKNPLTVTPKEQGRAEISLSLFGVMPIKTVNATVLPTVELTPCGMAVGVAMNTNGVMVLGTGFVTGNDNESCEPSKGLLKSGDLMKQAGGVTLDSKEALMEAVEKNGEKTLELVIERGGEEKTVAITPAYSRQDKCYKLGIWVRDSTQGIGTLTFYDEQTGGFGALGHGVYDIDTNQLMQIRDGKLTKSAITEVKKGEKGSPGELIGKVDKSNILGEIKENTDVGLYGSLLSKEKGLLNSKKMPIGLRQDIKEGSATILSNITGTEVREYDVEIESISKYSSTDSKGMVIKITDEQLLKTTGGIVQGMSGSPIIQDGKLIGAVTHVFVQDPTRGYGVFIENMLKEEQKAVA